MNASIKGACTTKIDGKSVFSQDDANAELHRLHREKAQSFDIEFAPERRLVGSQKSRVLREFSLSQPDVAEDQEHARQSSVEDVRNIASMRHPDVSFDREDLSNDEARFATNAISSQAIAAEEASIGNFATQT